MKNTSIHSLAAQTHAHGTSSNARGRAHPGSHARVLEASEVGEVEGRHRNLHGSRSLSPPSRPPQKPSWKHRAQTQGSGANSSKAERTALTQTKLRPFHRGARCENSKAQGSLNWASQAVVPTCQGFDCMNFSISTFTQKDLHMSGIQIGRSPTKCAFCVYGPFGRIGRSPYMMM